MKDEEEVIGKKRKHKEEKKKKKKSRKKHKQEEEDAIGSHISDNERNVNDRRSSKSNHEESTRVVSSPSSPAAQSPPPSHHAEEEDATATKDQSSQTKRSKSKESKKDKKKKDKKEEKKKKREKEKRKSASSGASVLPNSNGQQPDPVTRSSESDKHLKLKQQKEDEQKLLNSSNMPSQIVESSAIEFYDEQIKQKKTEKEDRAQDKFALSLLLFYQYIEPVWDEKTYNFMLTRLQKVGQDLQLTGRMRVAREGLNCTLTGSHESIVEYCRTLKRLRPTEFSETEFKMTSNLPEAQKFPNLKVLKVVELVHYGLEGSKAPPIAKFSGTHLEPKDYHQKLGESNTVIIDVRNHYEAAIGRFVPPSEGDGVKQGEAPPKWLDPKMRKSTEFPAWLDRSEVKEEMKGKQVLMYCTGGIRCERASALLKFKMETDPEIKELGIQGVFQLQGGIDKYFKAFPDGGYWKGKNYVFDKRFSHAPPKIDGELHGKVEESNHQSTVKIMGKCEACQKPWDMYRGKRRCPTCGVPSLICKDCFVADKEGRRKLGKEVRCDLCVEQGIKSKYELRQKDEQEIYDYESKMAKKGLLRPEALAPNPEKVTRLHLKNMCRKNMDEKTLCEALPGITHIVWRIDRKSDQFLGQGWVEMATPDDAARAILRDGKLKLFGRPMYISYQPPNGKDIWPPSSAKVGK